MKATSANLFPDTEYTEADAYFSAYVRGRGGRRSGMGAAGVRGVRRGVGGGI